MSLPTWRFIPDSSHPGPFNMAADVLLAEMSVATPVLRCYQWDPPAVSLGYHQSADDINADRCQIDGIDVVRRPTGGRAIFHADELTYSVVLPGSYPVAGGSVSTIHHEISRALQAGLSELGVPVTLSDVNPNLRQHYSAKVSSVPCFATTTEDELQLHGKKVVGSAQRKYPCAVLQHGSILLGATHRKLVHYLAASPDEQTSLGKLLAQKTTELYSARSDIRVTDLMEGLRRGFTSVFHCQFISQGWTQSEVQTIREREATHRVRSHEVA